MQLQHLEAAMPEKAQGRPLPLVLPAVDKDAQLGDAVEDAVD
jgi:hypothetical protein